jgi:hypothetical protein
MFRHIVLLPTLKNFLFKIILRILYIDYFKKIIIKLYNIINNDVKYNNFIFKKFDQDIIDKYTIINFDLPKYTKFKTFKNIFLLVDKDMEIKIISEDKSIYNKIKKFSTMDEINLSDIPGAIFFIGKMQVDEITKDVEKIIKNGGSFKALPISKNNLLHDISKAMSYRFTNTKCLDALRETQKNQSRISHFNSSLINTHENICEGIELTKNVEGDYVEIGVYMGGSALTALNYMKQINLYRRVYLLDTFNGFNYSESKKSPDVEWHGTHNIFNDQDKMKSHIKETLKEFNNYELVTSNICCDEIPKNIKNISLANIDVDMYEPTRDSLIKISKKMSKNGIIMCEDPVHRGLYGALYAMEDFLVGNDEGKKYIKIFKKNHYFLIKKY